MTESGTFRVGQEVQVSYRARVAEVSTGSSGQAAPILRLEPIDGSHATPPGGWVDPQAVIVEVVKNPLPDRPGVYWATAEAGSQASMDRWHTDGKEFHYLNTTGEWVDIGWGSPSNDAALTGPLVELPF